MNNGNLSSVLKRFPAGQDNLSNFLLPYMMVMRQGPTSGEDYEKVAYFYIEFYPLNRSAKKLKYLAGSETGTGVFVMDAAPEDTAAGLWAKSKEAAS